MCLTPTYPVGLTVSVLGGPSLGYPGGVSMPRLPRGLLSVLLTLIIPILFFFNWMKIALQYCIGFRHTTTRISHNYIYICICVCIYTYIYISSPS